MPLTCILRDITKMETDAIVNAANAGLREGGGVCGAIFRAAGSGKMQAACDRYGHCDTGKAVITGGFALSAKFVIHTVGPRYRQGDPNQAGLLYRCYRNSLHLAEEFHVRSIAFPLISAGIYGYPTEQAAQIAVTAILNFLSTHDMDVYLCVRDPQVQKLVEVQQERFRTAAAE